MKVALVQTNPTIGDIDGNTARVLEGLRHAAASGADLAVFPEQTFLGYPAKDLLLRREVIAANLAAVQRVADAATDVAALVGYAERHEQSFGRPLYNAAALVHRGRVVARWQKRLLPIYDVFDEVRYFEPGGPQGVCEHDGVRLGVTICEDMWSREEMMGQPLYACDPVRELAEAEADVIFNISASPYFLGKHELRLALLQSHARRNHVPILFVNQVGGNDEQIFDGGSCVVDDTGELRGQARAFAEDLLLVDLDDLAATRHEVLPADMANLHAALVLGLRDYVRKCGFESVVLGLSGGIDSAVVAAVAAAALGPAQVHGVAMPSRFSSDHSLADARRLAENLGIRFSVIEIEGPHAAFEHLLTPHFAGRAPDIAEENIQARCRGVILMALANKFGSLTLTTGNKSELAVGYCTLYGDMAGGLAVIADVPKTMVYRLARHINEAAGREVIPTGTLTKPPSAELKPDQTDQDTLPPYDLLDELLTLYVIENLTAPEIVERGYDARLVERVLTMVARAEYKRRQAPPVLKVSRRAFGTGRRVPVARHIG